MYMKEVRQDLGTDLDWTLRHFVNWHRQQADFKAVENKVAKNAADYALTYGLDGRPRLPNPGTHPSGHNWKSPLARFLRFAWGAYSFITSFDSS